MEPELAFRALGYAIAGVLLFAMLVITMISLRKEAHTDRSIDGLFTLTLIVLSICAFVALCAAYQTVKSLPKSPHFQDAALPR